MIQSLIILGRQPLLGLAELESLYGAGKVRPAGKHAAIVEVDPCRLAFNRLGGATKFCKILTMLDTTNWKQIEKFLIKVSPDFSTRMPEGKMHLGLSLYGFEESLKQVEATGLSIKKAIRKTGRSVRLAPNKSTELNTAQITHNKLLSQNGWELVLVRDGQQTIIAQTIKVQDIESYTLRDRGRPKRDARVGMLPPKLAQIIINLATGKLPEEKLSSICDTPAGENIPKPALGQTVLDPFCGTGVVLQEATLMGYEAYGTDIDPRMVEYTDHNLGWLRRTNPNTGAWVPEDLNSITGENTNVEQADATAYLWPVSIDFVASEAYLGRPFSSLPTSDVLSKNISNCNLIIKKFLQNIHAQLKPGTRLCLAVPAWQTKPNQFKHLPLVDSLEELGYNRVVLRHVRKADLLYYRSSQVVARELLVITRK